MSVFLCCGCDTVWFWACALHLCLSCEQLVRRRTLDRFAEQHVEDVDKVHKPAPHLGVGQRGVKSKKDTSNQLRYLNGVVVARKGERYIVEDSHKGACVVRGRRCPCPDSALAPCLP
jgi:hypothetical protein